MPVAKQQKHPAHVTGSCACIMRNAARLSVPRTVLNISQIYIIIYTTEHNIYFSPAQVKYVLRKHNEY